MQVWILFVLQLYIYNNLVEWVLSSKVSKFEIAPSLPSLIVYTV